MPDPFIGVGTGRCGTNSLANIVNACRNCRVSHEMFPVPWYDTDGNMGKLLRELKMYEGLRGEVASYLLPHIQDMRETLKNLKVVCLHRSKDQVVDSFLRWCNGSSNLRPPDRRLRMRREPPHISVYVHRFPLVDGFNPEQAWGFYWEICERMMERVAEPVLHLDVEQLNDDEHVCNLFDFLEIPTEDRVLIEQRKFNTWQQVVDRLLKKGRRRHGKHAV